jgi:hypothetical protein
MVGTYNYTTIIDICQEFSENYEEKMPPDLRKIIKGLPAEFRLQMICGDF